MPFAFSCPHCGASYQVKEELAGRRAMCKKCGETIELLPPQKETTAGGSTVFRHAAREREVEWSHGDDELIDAIEKHIERHLGRPENVFHELVSDLVHLDVHIVPARRDRPYITLVTSGMSERPMTTPPEVEGCEYAELVACLPPKWPLSDAALKDENNYWPVGGLKYLARLPHEYDTWLGPGHTIPNGDPAEPFASNTKFCCFMVVPALGAADEFQQLELADGRTIHMMSIVPLFKEEMDLKLRKGAESLYERLDGVPFAELFDSKRKNVAAKRFGLF